MATRFRQKTFSWLQEGRRFRFNKSVAGAFLAAAALSLVLQSFEFATLEALLYDWRMVRTAPNRVDPQIVLVTLDEATEQALGERTPFSLEQHYRFLSEVQAYHPKAIGYLVDLSRLFPEGGRREGARTDSKSARTSQKIVQEVERYQSQGGSFLLGAPYDVTGEVIPGGPLRDLPRAVAVIHKDGYNFSKDRVSRRAPVELYGHATFHQRLAEMIGRVKEGHYPPGVFSVPQIQGRYFYTRYHQSSIRCEKGGCDSQYPRVSFKDVIFGKVDPVALRGKVVLVESLMVDDPRDFVLTPVHSTEAVLPKIVVHANILDSIMNSEGIRAAPTWLNFGITFCLIACVLCWILTATPLRGFVATASGVLLFLIVSHVAFSYGIWLKESQTILGVFVSYYLAVPYRLIREYQKRWDIQKKHELLTQVEELKTNFLNLVTHDLKTPVARIQGLVEALQKKAADRLIDEDRQKLRSVVLSTKELNRFITSILELSRVESNELQIRKESKDINLLVEKVVDRFSEQARERNIRIECDLEPLFPIKIDSQLITKVVSNLIDNAIKYSHDHSKICVHSTEEGSWVVIRISDEGVGMTEEEKCSLFTRFYRARNERTSSISGHGLGLYLTRFFVEAHQGYVTVESQKEKGSEFKIHLPLMEIAAK